MSEKDLLLASELLKSENIDGVPFSIAVVATIDRKPYAYRIEYTNGGLHSKAIILKE